MLTPVQAVPAKAHAKGSRYQGEMEMRYTLSATLTTMVATAPKLSMGQKPANFITSYVKYQANQLYILSEVLRPSQNWSGAREQRFRAAALVSRSKLKPKGAHRLWQG